MTREEAIRHIRDILAENNSIKPSMVVFELEKEALYMAIKALEEEPCEDCISREDAINKIEEWANGFEEGSYFSGKSVADAIRACGGIIAELPPVRPKYTDEEIDRAQAVEQAYVDKMVEMAVEELKRPKGEWIDIEYFDREWTCYRPKCPFCNEEPKEYSNYCPNCGAKLREEDPDY